MGLAPLHALQSAIATATSGESPARRSTSHLLLISSISLGFGFWGLLLIHRTLLTWFTPGIATLATLVSALATGYPGWLFVSPATNHPLSVWAVALLLYLTVRVSRAPTFTLHVALGVAAGLAFLIRWQDVIWLLWPASAGIGQLVRAIRTGGALTRCLLLWTATSLAALAVASVQLMLWHVWFGTWFTVPQGTGFMLWSQPEWRGILYAGQNGLFSWCPWTLVATLGVFLFIRRAPTLAIAGLIAFLLLTYVNACVLDWGMSGTYGARRFLSSLPLWAIGGAALLARIPAPRVRLGIVILASGFNLTLFLIYTHNNLLTGWWGHPEILAVATKQLLLHPNQWFLGFAWELLPDRPDNRPLCFAIASLSVLSVVGAAWLDRVLAMRPRMARALVWSSLAGLIALVPLIRIAAARGPDRFTREEIASIWLDHSVDESARLDAVSAHNRAHPDQLIGPTLEFAYRVHHDDDVAAATAAERLPDSALRFKHLYRLRHEIDSDRLAASLDWARHQSAWDFPVKYAALSHVGDADEAARSAEIWNSFRIGFALSCLIRSGWHSVHGQPDQEALDIATILRRETFSTGALAATPHLAAHGEVLRAQQTEIEHRMRVWAEGHTRQFLEFSGGYERGSNPVDVEWLPALHLFNTVTAAYPNGVFVPWVHELTGRLGALFPGRTHHGRDYQRRRMLWSWHARRQTAFAPLGETVRRWNDLHPDDMEGQIAAIDVALLGARPREALWRIDRAFRRWPDSDVWLPQLNVALPAVSRDDCAQFPALLARWRLARSDSGDVNGDSVLDARDMEMMRDHILGRRALSDDERDRAELDLFPGIDVTDLVQLQTRIASQAATQEAGSTP
jgi:hypothetical protein